MRTECFAILVIMIIMIFSCLRARKYYFAIAISPLSVVPFFHLAGYLLSPPVAKLFASYSATTVHVGIDIFAAMLSCLLLGIFGHYFTSKKIRSTFLILSGIFTLAITWILILHLTMPGK